MLFFDVFLCYLQLFFVNCPNSTSVLCAIVWALSVHLSRIMHHKESLKELSETYEIRIIYDSDSLSMHGVALADLAISGIISSSLLIPRVG